MDSGNGGRGHSDEGDQLRSQPNSRRVPDIQRLLCGLCSSCKPNEGKDITIVEDHPQNEQAKRSQDGSPTVAPNSVDKADITKNSSEAKSVKRNRFWRQLLRACWRPSDRRKGSKKKILANMRTIWTCCTRPKTSDDITVVPRSRGDGESRDPREANSPSSTSNLLTRTEKSIDIATSESPSLSTRSLFSKASPHSADASPHSADASPHSADASPHSADNPSSQIVLDSHSDPLDAVEKYDQYIEKVIQELEKIIQELEREVQVVSNSSSRNSEVKKLNREEMEDIILKDLDTLQCAQEQSLKNNPNVLEPISVKQAEGLQAKWKKEGCDERVALETITNELEDACRICKVILGNHLVNHLLWNKGKEILNTVIEELNQAIVSIQTESKNSLLLAISGAGEVEMIKSVIIHVIGGGKGKDKINIGCLPKLLNPLTGHSVRNILQKKIDKIISISREMRKKISSQGNKERKGLYIDS